MTGPEHYAHAEELLDMAADEKLGSRLERYRIRKAQVHATLALAAATALSDSEDLTGRYWRGWHIAAGGAS